MKKAVAILPILILTALYAFDVSVHNPVSKPANYQYTEQAEGSKPSSPPAATSTGGVKDNTEAVVKNPQKENIPASKPVVFNGLVELIKLDGSFAIDLKYAATDNFTGKKIYTQSKCLIHKDTAQKLINANNEFKKNGYRIKIFDAYRPYSAQKVLWEAASDKSYVANPKKGSIHNRGAAVDITLVDEQENELDMPSGYDEFSKRAHLNYSDCSGELIKNREYLGKVMVRHGFKRISNEWWHFEDTNAKEYRILDIPFEKFPD